MQNTALNISVSSDQREESGCSNDEYSESEPEDKEETSFKYSEELFQCLMCDMSSNQVFSTPLLVKHMEAKHGRYFRCPHCYSEFPEDERLLKLHLEVCSSPCLHGALCLACNTDDPDNPDIPDNLI